MDILDQKQRRAAHGRHVCGFCRQRIAAGEVYDDCRIADSGTAWTWRSHLRCLAFMREVSEPADWDNGVDAIAFEEALSAYPDIADELGMTKTVPRRVPSPDAAGHTHPPKETP